MERKNNVIAIITARGGSKGLPRKNVRNLAGKPLIAHSILAALNSSFINRCIVSTEDEEIKQVSLQWGAEICDRPIELATDYAMSKDVVCHALLQLHDKGVFPDYFVLLQPTSPLRTEKHLDECLDTFLSSNFSSVMSVAETEHHPYKCLTCDDSGQLQPFHDVQSLDMPRQLLPKVFRQNGAIYGVRTQLFLKARTFFVPPVMSYVMSANDSIDIDNRSDLEMAEVIIKNKSFVGAVQCEKYKTNCKT
ncbi:cytidylyltransferase domain-containing protein [Sporomusa sp. KB1]|uniref:acylneuraminate cytidylyltransferase family protein n=1 Tax=Sporomusa sp. KB1 TaxID=943346 RepID=UPI0011ACEF6C|nr:acylneuraminate cytidylyltransferase family protein [Sporomusa sp. KB1]TWH45288.1 N-acylneuraminate cytidylyltransferase/CMP-N,N'-diacetyllegionaminic acid synthase [Sporomusa sp. KB1]